MAGRALDAPEPLRRDSVYCDGSVVIASAAEALRVLVFSDAGQVRSHQAGAGINAREGASSAGAGLRYQWRRNLSVSLDWAQVMKGAGTTNKHDNRAHLVLSVRY